ncbi:hypothetical protein BLL37_15420 [Pseudomonas azotoformans]|uniref:Fimbrial-type adhesion domain-containing protein n=2 Tax=Pseudomonas azotoformans TaxID=47878 RepID=A0A1V2JHI6_PSEAZ|nr:hypothetical protein BFL39_21375 [Pseudomonas azotoformans]ONH44709.1 hypothetical protein BLL37_15420 [Pseudomonas azotoformans]
MRGHPMKRLAACVLALLLTALTLPVAWAGGDCDAAAPTLINVPAIDPLPVNPSPGQVLGNPDGYTFDVPNAMVCRYDDVFSEYWSYISLSSDLNFTGSFFFHYGVRMPIYRTGVTGVGMGMIAEDRDNRSPQAVSTGISVLHPPIYPGIPSWGLRGRLFFFVTGPIQGGLIASRPIARFAVRSATGEHMITLGSTLIGPPRKPTCSVSTPSLAMRLGTVSARDFSGIGSTAGAVTETIMLQCAGGTGASLDVLVTLTDQTAPANRSNRLSLTGESTARGVALQLLHQERLLSYGPDSSAIGTPNQWLAGTTDNGTFTIPLTARYVQTAARIQAGTANGQATFTLSYR